MAEFKNAIPQTIADNWIITNNKNVQEQLSRLRIFLFSIFKFKALVT